MESIGSTLTGTVIGIDGRFVQFDADPGAPAHLSRLFLGRWPGDTDLVGKRIRIRYYATRSYGEWRYLPDDVVLDAATCQRIVKQMLTGGVPSQNGPGQLGVSGYILDYIRAELAKGN